MSEQLQDNHGDIAPNGYAPSNELSKEIQKLLTQRPELQQWRDEIIAQQVE
jgi:hypothetical protein